MHMKKIFCLCILILFSFSFSATAQILSSTSSLTTSLDNQTQGFFIGTTAIDGVFQGFKMDILEDYPLVYEINVIPLFGYTVIESIEMLKIIDINSITFESLKDIENISDLDGMVFTDVDIIAERGCFLLSSNTGQLHVNAQFEYAMSSFMNQPIKSSLSQQFFFVSSDSAMTSQFSGDISYITSYNNQPNQRVQIKNSDGSLLWSDNPGDYVFVIEDQDFTFYQKSSLYLLPVPLLENRERIHISVTPSNTADQEVSSLLQEVVNTSENIDLISDISQIINQFQPLITSLSPILDGGLILINTEDTVVIDGAVKSFSQFGFARGNTFDIIISNQTQNPTISGDFKLVFLGDHMYTSQAKESQIGVSFPLLIFSIWVIALVLFVLFRFYPKLFSTSPLKNIDEQQAQKIKKYGFLFHLIAIIVVFILIDREISFQFGTSVLDALFSFNFSLILFAFIGIQLLLWSVGFLALALPIKIISNSILQYLGMQKSTTSSIAKGIGVFGIWVFTAVYVKLVINLIFLFINASELFSMG